MIDSPGPHGCPDPGDRIRPDPELIRQGWTRRSLLDPARAGEVVKLYTDIGFEVWLQKVDPALFAAACRSCAVASCRQFLTVYTRPRDP